MNRSLVGAMLMAVMIVAAATADSGMGASQVAARQEHAQALARAMLGNLLDSHVQQLEENHLTDTPIYQDLRALRDRMDELVNRDMTDVLGMLARGIELEGPKQAEQMALAQSRMRQILVRLLAEREKLRIRRKHAELINMVGEVLEKQIDTHTMTRVLTVRDEQAALQVSSSQQTVNALYGSLSKSLDEVSAWSGDLGAAAGAASKLLAQGKVEDTLDKAMNDLSALRFPDAAASQEQAITKLKKVLAELRRLIMPISETEEALRQVRVLLKQQHGLRDAVKATPLTDNVIDSLYNRQAGIQQGVQKLFMLVPDGPRTSPLLVRADSSAGEAGKAIFNADQPAALDQQDRVIGSLAQLEKELEDQINRARGFKSADELDREAAQLAKAKKLVAEALGHAQQAKADAVQAPARMTQAKDTLTGAGAIEGIPALVRTRIGNASRDTGGDVDVALDSVRLALGETTDALARDQRDALAVRLGELNRAAEALNRAAAAARLAAGDLKADPPAADRAKLLRTQAKEVAEHIDEGVRNTVPATEPLLRQAIEAADRPMVMSDHLDAAAQEIRKAMVRVAERLEIVATDQIAEVDGIKTQVDEARRQADTGHADAAKMKSLAEQTTMQVPDIGWAVRDAVRAIENPSPEPAPKPASDEDEDGAAGDPLSQANTVNQELSRAQVLAEVRLSELEEYLRLAREMAALAKAQMQAAGQIAQGRETIENGAADEQLDQAGREMLDAMNEFASAATTLGEAVEKATGQWEIANQPIREGVVAASAIELHRPPEPPEGSGGNQDASPPGQGGDNAVVPQDAQGTAQAMAGQQGAAAAKAAELAQQNAADFGGNPNDSMQPPPKDSRVDTSAARTGDAQLQDSAVTSRAWTTHLPPAMRQAMQAAQNQPPLPGYEERLRQYFGSETE